MLELCSPSATTSQLSISNAGADGYVIIDAVQFVPVEVARAERAASESRRKARKSEPVQLASAARPADVDGKSYDLVVVGGGYAGMGTAIAAARMGITVVLIQNRPVLGGNGSSEVRVWANGLTRRGRFPRIGEIVAEFEDDAKKSPGTAEEFGDELKERLVRAEKNIDLMLNQHWSYEFIQVMGIKI